MIVGIEIEISSGNVFADLGLADAEKLKIKSGLVIEITRAVRRLGLMQEEAGRRMGIAQPKVSAMMRGHFVNPSKHKLIDPHAGTRLASARPVMSEVESGRASYRPTLSTSNPTTLRCSRLNSTPIRWMGSPSAWYLSA